MTDQAIVDHKRSVKKSEFGKSGAAKLVFWLPRITPNTTSALPPRLPDPPVTPYYGVWQNQRDEILNATVKFESMWGGVVGIEASKFAASGWALKSDKPRVQERVQNILLNSTVGVLAGWVPFSSAGFAGFVNTGKRFIEIERYTTRAGSRIKALHHLDPTRCFLTTDPQIPVLYSDSDGREHEIKRHQIMMFFDMPDPTEKNINAPYSCGVRAYDGITQLAAAKWYIYEKITGRTPLAFHFVQGVSESTIEDAIESAQNEADSKGVQAYMGAVISAIMGDTPMELITVPLAEIPDGVDIDQIRKYAHLEYANALGEDPTRIDPQLIGNRQLGAGTQAVVLDQKARQGGVLISHKQDFSHALMQLLRQEKIQFAFTEVDFTDQKADAENKKVRAETRKTQIESGEISPEMARNLAVDQGDLPQEFLPEDETMTDVITDSEQPERDKKPETLSNDDLPTESLEETEKQVSPEDDDELDTLILESIPVAQELYEGAKNG